jgi:hypothetical protein
MSTPARSSLGAFVRSPLGVRGRRSAATTGDIDWYSVTYGDGKFIAIGDDYVNSERVLYIAMSTDGGVNWVIRDDMHPNDDSATYNIRYLGGQWVLVSPIWSGYWVSSDLSSWQYRPKLAYIAPSNYWGRGEIGYLDGEYVCLTSKQIYSGGHYKTYVGLITSSDLVSGWTLKIEPDADIPTPIANHYGYTPIVNFDGCAFFPVVDLYDTPGASSMIYYDGASLVGVPDSILPTTTMDRWGKAAANASRIVATMRPDAGSEYFSTHWTSTDKNNWGQCCTSPEARGLAASATSFCTIHKDEEPVGNVKVTRYAGGTPLLRVVHSGASWRPGEMAHGNGVFVAVGTEGQIVHSTDDGETWSRQTVG